MACSLIPTRVLITVMTYPHPSTKYRELVCTAGITEEGEWVRLYPIDYRYCPRHQQFRKYQWIKLDLEPRGRGNDRRKESRKPNRDSIEILGPPIDTKNAWAKRRSIIDNMPHHTVKQLISLYKENKTSLGIVRPTEIVDLKIEKTDSQWKPEWRQELQQLRLFECQPKKLRKIPFRFSYVFRCEDSKKPHQMMIEDWELGVLFLKQAERLGSDKAAAESVRHKFLDVLCSDKNDVRFFLGTVFPFPSWIVLGVFYPPKVDALQEDMFP